MTHGALNGDQKIRNAQLQQWQCSFSTRENMFGTMPSDPATIAVAVFKSENRSRLLELGGGQGRDTLFFAQCGLDIVAVDYCADAVEAIAQTAEKRQLLDRLRVIQHDVRQPLPFPANSFDCCFSHMLYCMALTTDELIALSNEVWRVLRPSGLNIYTVRHTGDPHYRSGVHRGEDMYEVGGFIVHFFNSEKVELLAKGFEIVGIDEFEEGNLPRKLFRVTLRKKGERL